MDKKVKGSTTITLNIDFDGTIEVRDPEPDCGELPQFKIVSFEGDVDVQSQNLDTLITCTDVITCDQFIAIPFDLLDMTVIEHLEEKGPK